jgi:hypothetical protein
MEAWSSRVPVDSFAAIALSTAMARSLLDFLSCDINQGQKTPPLNSQGVASGIRSLATDLQVILEEAMATFTIIFPRKPSAPKRGTFHHHLWPKSVRHDVDNVRRRVKNLRRLVNIATRNHKDTLTDPASHIAILREVDSPLHIRTIHSPPPRDLAFLGILQPQDLALVYYIFLAV